MKVIASVLIDKYGHIKYTPQSFKPNDCDICITNIQIGSVGKKSLYYTPLLILKDERAEDVTWTVKETIRRCEESQANIIKIFTRIQDFYEEIDELQFAYTDELKDWDEEISMTSLKMFCNNANREFLGESNGIKFFRYTIDKNK